MKVNYKASSIPTINEDVKGLCI